MNPTARLRQLIADAIFRTEEFSPYPLTDDILTVTFRPGCAEIQVTYRDGPEDQPVPNVAIIDAAPILSLLLQQAIDAREN